MDIKDQFEFAKNQLDRTLAFFPRVDTKLSMILGIDIAMLAVLATVSPPLKSIKWYLAVAAIPALAFLIASLWQVYRASFPQLEGGGRSLIYFRSIAERTEAEFIEEVQAGTAESLKKDLLSQIWRNSQILKQKFDYLKSASTLLALAIPFWLIALTICAATNTELKTFLAK